MPLRLVSNGFNHRNGYGKVVDLFAEVTHGFDTEHLTYVISRNITVWQIIPQGIVGLAKIGLRARVSNITQIPYDMLVKAAVEARPDCADLLQSPTGLRWLEHNFSQL